VTFKRAGYELSTCGRYRYLLRLPTGIANDRIALLIGANPSTATAERFDPTIRRWVKYCRRLGYGWAWTCNVRAWRETHPGKVPNDELAIGPLNDEWILAAAESADLVVCGWGRLGGERGWQVTRSLLATGVMLYSLRVNQDGTPGHPLYLPYLPRGCGPELWPREVPPDTSVT
jgi:hypothetical protein